MASLHISSNYMYRTCKTGFIETKFSTVAILQLFFFFFLLLYSLSYMVSTKMPGMIDDSWLPKRGSH